MQAEVHSLSEELPKNENLQISKVNISAFAPKNGGITTYQPSPHLKPTLMASLHTWQIHFLSYCNFFCHLIWGCQSHAFPILLFVIFFSILCVGVNTPTNILFQCGRNRTSA